MRVSLSLAGLVSVVAALGGACQSEPQPMLTVGSGSSWTTAEESSSTAPTSGEPTTTATTTATGTTTTTTSETAAPTTTTPIEPTAGTTTEDTSSSAGTSTTEGTTTSETGESTTEGEECGAPGILVVCDGGDDTDPFHAIGVGCAGAPENTIPITDEVFMSQAIAWRAATGYGTAEDPNAPGQLLFRPREGEKLLVLSSGRVASPQLDGSVIETTPQYENDNNFNPDMPDALPAPMSPLNGSNGGQGGTPFAGCDGVNDCSDSVAPNWTLGGGDPNDLLFGAFTVTAPPGVDGFLFDAVFFSSEYPEFVGEQFNDMFIGWSTSEAYTGNVTFFDGQPFTVTSLAPAMENAGFVGDAPELAGTGFESHGSTGWVTIQAQVTPGETFTFAFAIMDMGDSSKATVTLVDHWRWDCKGCVPIEVDPLCGTEGHPKCCGLCVDVLDDPLCDTEGHPKCCTAG